MLIEVGNVFDIKMDSNEHSSCAKKYVFDLALKFWMSESWDVKFDLKTLYII